jgi:hypothetical protein
MILLHCLRSLTTLGMTRWMYYKVLGLYGLHSIQIMMAKQMNETCLVIPNAVRDLTGSD